MQFCMMSTFGTLCNLYQLFFFLRKCKIKWVHFTCNRVFLHYVCRYLNTRSKHTDFSILPRITSSIKGCCTAVRLSLSLSITWQGRRKRPVTKAHRAKQHRPNITLSSGSENGVRARSYFLERERRLQ